MKKRRTTFQVFGVNRRRDFTLKPLMTTTPIIANNDEGEIMHPLYEEAVREEMRERERERKEKEKNKNPKPSVHEDTDGIEPLPPTGITF